MAGKINKCEYEIRTLSFYQGRGGVYNDIITILVNMRSKSMFRGMASPAQILNKASFNNDTQSVKGVDNLTLCVMACITNDTQFLSQIQHLLQNDNVYYPQFKHLIGNSIASKEKQVLNQELSATIDELKDLIEKQDMTIAELSKTIDSLRQENHEIKTRCAMVEQCNYKGSEFDRLLTLDTILKWIESRHHYNYTEQVFRMLADLKDRVATDEERMKISALESQMLDKNQTNAVFNQNFALNSNMMTGVVNDPQLPIGCSPADIQNLFRQFISQINNGEGAR